MAAGRDADPTDQTPGNGGGQQLILPLLMYTVVPFIPSTVLSTLNDNYLAVKEQFNSAAAALPPNMATDSAEYLSASSMYNESMQQLFVLLLSKRLALYFLATLATTYAGWRASAGVAAIRDGSFGGPGDALDRLNREVLEGERFSATADESEGLEEGAEVEEDDERKKEEDQLFATLVDDNPESSNIGNALALALPLVLGASLAFSYLVTISAAPVVDESSFGSIQEILSPYLPYVLPLPSAILCLLFVATEFRWALPPSSEAASESLTTSTSDPPLLCTANILALAYVVGAYGAKINPTLSLNGINLDLWPVQNGVNIALAATVTRALAPFLLSAPSSSSSTMVQSPGKKSIRTVALALVGLTLFDAISTFGTVANAATTADAASVTATATAAQSSMSVMETVARSKLASWQPGLLEIILGHDNSKVTEALGLGDVVFPSILVAWGFVADKDNDANNLSPDTDIVDGSGSGGLTSDKNNENSLNIDYSSGRFSSYTLASIVGYLFGSLSTEIVGSFELLGNRSGLPALVFLVPSMLGAVTMMAWSRKELGDVWGVGIASSHDGDA